MNITFRAEQGGKDFLKNTTISDGRRDVLAIIMGDIVRKFMVAVIDEDGMNDRDAVQMINNDTRLTASEKVVMAWKIAQLLDFGRDYSHEELEGRKKKATSILAGAYENKDEIAEEASKISPVNEKKD